MHVPSKLSAFRRHFDKTNYFFLMKSKKLLEKYNKKFDTNIHDNKIPKEGCQCFCLSVILIDSIYRKDKNYYSKVFLEECKYVVKEKKTSKFITGDIETSSHDSDRENSDEDNYRIINFFEKNIRNFLILGLETSISQNIRNF